MVMETYLAHFYLLDVDLKTFGEFKENFKHPVKLRYYRMTGKELKEELKGREIYKENEIYRENEIYKENEILDDILYRILGLKDSLPIYRATGDIITNIADRYLRKLYNK